jgi:hypothetical protein
MLFVAAMSRVLLSGRIRQRLIVCLLSLLFLLLRIQTTTAQQNTTAKVEIAVRMLFHGGIISKGKGCKVPEFEAVKDKVSKKLKLKLNKRQHRSMQTVNCKLCFMIFEEDAASCDAVIVTHD